MFFVADAQVLRDRWYWSRPAGGRDHPVFPPELPAAHPPVAPDHFFDAFHQQRAGVVLGQNFDNYADALSSIQRFSRWKIAERDVIEPDAVHTVNFRFRLTSHSCPVPFQIGAVGRSGWNLLVSRSQRLAQSLPSEHFPFAIRCFGIDHATASRQCARWAVGVGRPSCRPSAWCCCSC